MLILARNCGESVIFVNENITLTILSIKGRQVKIGIKAPDAVKVLREEVYDRIVKEKDLTEGKSHEQYAPRTTII